jgi:hypothetical protein
MPSYAQRLKEQTGISQSTEEIRAAIAESYTTKRY